MTVINRTKTREILRIFALYRAAFPVGERKPFGKILRMAKEGRADLWTIRHEGRFAGFAATVNSPELVLLDYFAVKKSLRGRGVGGNALRLLNEAYHDRGFFLEIESTRETGPGGEVREKRKQFYLRCGLEPLDVYADVFGVPMELLGRNCKLDFDGYYRFYRDRYSPWAAEHIRRM